MRPSKRVLIVDNYDSFTYNLAQYLAELGASVEVVRNDRISVDHVAGARYDRLVISPGPGRPESAGISLDVIRTLGRSVPILGVCLGHQAIGEAYGARLIRGPYPVHGKASEIVHDGKKIFSGIPSPLKGGRYHSLILERDSLPDCLEVSAETGEGLIMGVRHREWAVEGLQFHPESVMTASGRGLLENFIHGDFGTGEGLRGRSPGVPGSDGEGYGYGPPRGLHETVEPGAVTRIAGTMEEGEGA